MKKIILFSCIISISSFCYSLETENRITLGSYNEFNSESKRGLMELGYDFIFNTAYLTSTYNLFDFGIGLSCIFIWDDIGQFEIPTVGFAFNTSVRIYAPIIKAARLYLGLDLRPVMYTEEYPQNGTMLNIGWRIGPGMDYKLDDGTRLFGTLCWWHTSNANVYGKERNPSVNCIGISFGIQFNNN